MLITLPTVNVVDPLEAFTMAFAAVEIAGVAAPLGVKATTLRPEIPIRYATLLLSITIERGGTL